MMLLASIALAACLPLPAGASKVTAGDLHFQGVPPQTPLSPAPDPGVQRVFHIPELRQWAARLHMAADPQEDICVERAMAPLEESRLLAAMRSQLPDARIEIFNFLRGPAPQGEIVFR